MHNVTEEIILENVEKNKKDWHDLWSDYKHVNI